ncbi:MAG: HlyD family type I secretion periplasmic adaptor subunit [Legionellales bacterium]|nr:HlyD family type I secretion periplasmic adaptor subunit [Legionellales bacterium]
MKSILAKSIAFFKNAIQAVGDFFKEKKLSLSQSSADANVTMKEEFSLKAIRDKKSKLEPLEYDYISDYKKALLDLRVPFTSSLIYIISAFLVILIIWAYFAVVAEVTHSPGKVIPPSKIKIIQSLDGGILKELYVHEGQIVKKGEILLQIDDTQFNSLYREEYSKYLHVLASVARLTAEIKQQSTIQFPQELENYPKITQLERDLFEERMKNFQESVQMLQKSHDLVKQELALTKPLVEQGAASQIELLRLEHQVNELSGKIEERKANFYESSKKELTVFNAELKRLTEVIKSREDKLQRTTIVSPVDGVIQAIHIMTRGGVITPGMNIMEIVPQEPYLIIEAKVAPADIGFLRVGQEAKVKFTAYDYAIFGGLDAKVTYISADTFTDDKGGVFYKVEVKTDQNYLDHHGKHLGIKVGMQTSVDIVTGHKSILTYLLKPILRAKENALVER